MAKSSTQQLDVDVDRILRNQGPVDIETMMEAIRRVNPTDRTLPKAERQRRYEAKSALQSLLVRRFANQLRVEQDLQNEGVVLLTPRFFPKSGTHAAVAELQDDARSWVQMQLDLGPDEAELSLAPEAKARKIDGPSEQSGSVAELLVLGQDALEIYDFETAQAVFEQAFRISKGSRVVSEALLALLVEHLGADDQALELSISSEAARSPTVRLLLAQAAGRLGKGEVALDWLRGVELPPVMELLAEIGESAARNGERALADTAVVQLRLRDPRHGAIARIQALMRDRSAADLAPQEAKLRLLMDANDFEQAQVLARSVRERYPDSAVADLCLRKIDERKRNAKADLLLKQAQSFAIDGEFEEVGRLTRELIALGPSQENLRKTAQLLLDDAESKLKQARDDAEVLRVVELFEPGMTDRGARAFLDLSLRLRQRVRALAILEDLEWLEQASAPRAVNRDAAIGAVLALRRVSDQVSADPEKFLSLLEPHEACLGVVARAALLFATARREVETRRKTAALEALLLVEERLQAGESAASFLSKVDASCLTEQYADRYASCVARVEKLEQSEADESRLLGLEKSGDLFCARDFAEEVQERCDPEQQSKWQERASRFQAKIQESWWVGRPNEEAEQGKLSPIGLTMSLSGTKHRIVRSDGTSLLLASCTGNWVWVAEMNLSSGILCYRMVFHAPEEMRLEDLTVEKNDLWLVARKSVAMLDLLRWEIRRWWKVEPKDPKESVCKLVLFPGGKTFAMETSFRRYLDRRLHILEAKTGAVKRSVEGCKEVRSVPGSTARAIMVDNVGATNSKMVGFSLIDDRGLRLQWKGSVEDFNHGQYPVAAVSADREGYVLVYPPLSDDRQQNLRLRLLSKTGEMLQELLISGGGGFSQTQVATSLHRNMVFVLFAAQGRDDLELAAFLWKQHELSEIYRRRMPEGTQLVGDDSSERAFAVLETEKGITAVELSAAPPVLRGAPRPKIFQPMPELGPLVGLCAAHSPQVKNIVRAINTSFGPLDRVAAEKKMRSWMAKAQSDLDTLLALEHTCQSSQDSQGKELREFAQKHHLADPRVRQMLAIHHSRNGRWAPVLELLAPVCCADLPVESQRHHYHLLGIACAAAGDFDAAHKALNAGLECEGECEFNEWIELTNFALRGADPSWLSPNQPALRQRLAMIPILDRLLENEDYEEAVKMLDRSEAREGELQLSARFAEAIMKLSSRGGHISTPNAWAMARFCSACGNAAFPVEIPLPKAMRWSSDKLRDVRDRGEIWLKEWSRQLS